MYIYINIYIYIYTYICSLTHPPRHAEMHFLVPRCPQSHKVTDPKSSKIPKFRNLVKSLGFWVSAALDLWSLRFFDFSVLDFWIFGFLHFGSLGFWDFWMHHIYKYTYVHEHTPLGKAGFWSGGRLSCKLNNGSLLRTNIHKK